MALLTADDVLNKKFQATKFREGYDQDEVDDFLDEVVNTLRSVTAENDDLKGKLAAAERRIAELSRAGGGQAQTPAPVAQPEPTPQP
ncbi:DivIVA domain-containing protein, partial [Actinotalea sp. C106]|uniref:DivIVA domain-containing protein n=1 Tax=Actinotalea sp. C106 TaxID=2908644 RepID=UPI002027AD2B